MEELFLISGYNFVRALPPPLLILEYRIRRKVMGKKQGQKVDHKNLS
jgi:hypothetical protein